MALLLDIIVFVIVARSLELIARRVWGPMVEDASVYRILVAMFTLLFTALYTTVLHALGGQTIGKMLLRVRVVAVTGQPLPLGASVLRYVAYTASLLPFGIGWLMAGLRADKRALHDLIAGSRVDRLAAPEGSPSPAAYPDNTTPSSVV